MTRYEARRIALALAVAVSALPLAFASGAGAQTSTTSSTSSTSTSTTSTSTSTTSTSTTVPATTSTTICPPQRCSAAPPTAFLAGSKGEVAGEQGSYCWSAGPGNSAACRDSIFIDPTAALAVTRGELLSLRFASSEPPQEMKLYRHDRRNGNNQPLFAGVESVLSATNPTVVRADFPEGTSWLVVASTWSQGSTVTFFKVTVKSAAAKQPVPLALTG